ncbi:MAG: hypothetical protein AB8D52_10410 [Gammaproteobacteria bacterium]
MKVRVLKKMRNVITAIFLLLITGNAVADTLLIEAVEKNSDVERPVRGTTMKEVEKIYGEAINKYNPIGKPPITKWVYTNITVYFERGYVIHSVVNRKNLTGN